jgi:hypothetical protein
MPQAKPESFKAVIERIVFGFILGLGMLFFGGVVVPTIYGHWRTRSKTTVPATVTSVETVVGRKTTVATYEYESRGRTYRGDRISLWAYPGRFHRELDFAHRRNARITVYIDPKDPSYSVYDRGFTLWPFSGAVIMALGTAGFGFYGLRWCSKQRSRGTVVPAKVNIEH